MRDRKVQGVIFDFDGVLADSFWALFQVVHDAFAAVGRSLDPQQYRDFYLQNVKRAEQEALGDVETFMNVQTTIKERLPSAYAAVSLFGFVDTLIPRIASIARLAIVSASSAVVINKVLDDCNLGRFFEIILGAEGGEISKKEKLEKTVHHFGYPKDAITFVSDTAGDIQEGLQIGLQTIGVSWGFHGKEVLQGVRPHHLVDSPEALCAVLV